MANAILIANATPNIVADMPEALKKAVAYDVNAHQEHQKHICMSLKERLGRMR